MTDEKQVRLEARARIDIKNFYDRGQVSSKDYAAAFWHVKFVWLGHLTDAQIDEFVRKEIRELELWYAKILSGSHSPVFKLNVTLSLSDPSLAQPQFRLLECR